MTPDFTTQITAAMTPEQVAETFADWCGTVTGTVDREIVVAKEDLAWLVAADRAARDRGFTPGDEHKPAFGEQIVVLTDTNRRYLARWDGHCFHGHGDEYPGNIVRWWHLPGEKK